MTLPSRVETSQEGLLLTLGGEIVDYGAGKAALICLPSQPAQSVARPVVAILLLLPVHLALRALQPRHPWPTPV